MLIIVGLLVLLLFFAPATLALSAFALLCASVFRGLLRRPALSRGVRCLIYAVVIAGVRLACPARRGVPAGTHKQASEADHYRLQPRCGCAP